MCDSCMLKLLEYYNVIDKIIKIKLNKLLLEELEIELFRMIYLHDYL